jgi:HEAT repeat protein/Fe-S cluster biogenesis protein NfuA
MFGLFGPNIEKMRQDSDVVGLIALLNHKKQKTREKAAQALAAIGPPAVKPLIAVLQSEDQYTCNYAAWTLGVIGDDRAVEPLVEALNDTRRSLRRNVARALLVMADPRAIDPLISALEDPCLEVRRLAVRALGSFGGARAVEALLNYQSSHKFSDEIIVDALTKIGQSAVEPLTNALDSEHYSVVGVTAAALGKIRDPRALEPLVSALRKKIHPEIANALELFRWEPATALDAACFSAAKKKWEQCLEIGAPAVEVLTRVIDDPDWPETARQEAMKILAKLTGTEEQQEVETTAGDTEEHPEVGELEEISETEIEPEIEAATWASEVEEPETAADQIHETSEIDSPPAEAVSSEAPEPGDEVPEAESPAVELSAASDMEVQESAAETVLEQDTSEVSFAAEAINKEVPSTVSTQMRERVEDIIYSRVRPMLRTEGRDIKVVDVTEGVVYVSLKCEDPDLDRIPLENAVSSRIRELIREIVFVKFV